MSWKSDAVANARQLHGRTLRAMRLQAQVALENYESVNQVFTVANAG
jgi:hypothetical protein